MDPLSLIANLVAVANAATAISQKLQKLASIRHVPQQILQLINEVSDFRCVLTSIGETLHHRSGTNGQMQDLEFDHYVQRLLERGVAKLDEIDKVLDGGLIRNLDIVGTGRVKVLWTKWLRNGHISHLQALSTDLRNIRRDISQALTILTASEGSSVRIRFEAITSMQDETKNIASEALEKLGTQLESISQRITNIQPSLNGVQNMIQQLQHGPQPLRTHFPPPSDTFQSNSQDPGSIFRISTAMQRSCNTSCRCQCHRTTSLNSPQWMKSFVGLLFVGYSGSPVFGKRFCSERLCQQQSSSILRINYYFPSWFLHRIVVFRDYTSSLLAGEHMISVRTPRIIDRASFTMIVAQGGNVKAMQTLFSQGLASPFDSSVTGVSLLQYAAIWKRPDMCRLLLAESADPNQDSIHNGSPVDVVWSYVLQDPLNPLHQELKHIFDPFLDADNDLQSMKFSVVHQCVLGLNKMDLEQYLQLTTSDLESRCSLGRPPLFWAASCSNLSATKILLKFGATTDYADPKGQNVLHRAVMGSDINVLKTILKTVALRNSSPCMHHSPVSSMCDNLGSNPYPCTECSPNLSLQALLDHEDQAGWTALCFAAYQNKPNYAKILLDHGAKIDLDNNKTTPLLVAIQVSADPIIELLLKRGSKTNGKDVQGEGLMHMAAQCSSNKILRLLEAYKVCCLDTTDRNLFGSTALELFDKVRHKFVSEDEQAFLESRRVFLELLDGINQRVLEHGCLRKGGPVDSVCEVLDTASLYSDGDDFFDASSTFEESFEEPATRV